MTKVFLIGRFNDSFETINNFLAAYFNVQVCVDNLALIKGMLKLNQPDVIVVCMSGLEAEKAEIFQEIKAEYS